jgi:hypothetical protein
MPPPPIPDEAGGIGRAGCAIGGVIGLGAAGAGAAGFGAATGFAAAAGLRAGALRAAGLRAAAFFVVLRAEVLREVARFAALRAGAFFAPVFVLRALVFFAPARRALALLVFLRPAVRFFPLVLVAMALCSDSALMPHSTAQTDAYSLDSRFAGPGLPSHRASQSLFFIIRRSQAKAAIWRRISVRFAPPARKTAAAECPLRGHERRAGGPSGLNLLPPFWGDQVKAEARRPAFDARPGRRDRARCGPLP